MQLDEKWNERVKSIVETEKTWTIVFPFQEGEQTIGQIYELYPLDKTEASPETETAPSSIKPLNERGNN